MPRSLARTVAVTATLIVATANLTATPAAAASDVTLTPILDGYTRPVLVTHAGDGRTIFIVEQTGKIKRATFENGEWQKLGTFLDLSDKVVDPRTRRQQRARPSRAGVPSGLRAERALLRPLHAARSAAGQRRHRHRGVPHARPRARPTRARGACSCASTIR